ncbi:DUF3189 family protein [Irregularibacter muris]|uniref:DUF3189 family protein n=1 Tax=Irregularibacter muris TaxID=1796619 RepID=A0AAE3HDN6_9FIRM|nr:DUF3189 family protein [Irregularibacter muris]MCR1898196.1 DUF3189 family protein [Irregularibacter muris]
MKIIYYCYGGAHSSVLSAAIHVGMLPTYRIPRKEEFFSIPNFDITTNDEIGTPLYMGMDIWYNEVYCMGLGPLKEKALSSILFLEKHREEFLCEQAIFIYALPIVDVGVRIGGFLSRGLGITFLGRTIIIQGLQRRYFEFVKLVNRVISHNILKDSKEVPRNLS